MPRKPRQTPRIRTGRRRIALATVSGLAAGSIVLSSGYTALAQPTPSPSDTHTTESPSVEPPAPEITHTTESAPVQPPAKPPAKPTTPVRPPEETIHTVVPGDTLWGIAKKYLGAGLSWPTIYDPNKSLIETVARKFGHSSSGNGHLIFPGTRVRVRKTGLIDVGHKTPSQTIPPCTHGTFMIGLRGTSESAGPNSNRDVALGDPVGDVAKRLRSPENADPNGFYAYGVPYPATFINPTITTSEADGIAMTKAVLEAHAKCTGEKIVIVGYSQGAAVARKALAAVSPEVRAKVKGLVVFGDPLGLLGGPSPKSFPGIPAASYCQPGDPVCTVPLNPARAYQCFTVGCSHMLYAPFDTSNAARFLGNLTRR
ncbi:cutinase family protein [Streptomyces sp. NBC_00882]|uniref:cutinase family protein n=1 Tax=Streptomyces sp. NBC_00882 TaxID=2975856 RepID=UPI00386FE9E3|nr:cutinase family protein [Streptomyces sp. NBC_00882]WSZ36857.1 cutinase family protein [Streptomyces sp. NBC_00882]